jgi:hypothetical protein
MMRNTNNHVRRKNRNTNEAEERQMAEEKEMN